MACNTHTGKSRCQKKPRDEMREMAYRPHHIIRGETYAKVSDEVL